MVRITALPDTLIDKFIYDVPNSVLDVLPATHLANPIALGVHVTHYLLLAPLLTGKDEDYSVLRSSRDRQGVSGRWDRYEDTAKPRGRSLAGGWFVSVSSSLVLVKFYVLFMLGPAANFQTFLFTLILFVIALSNTTYLFTRFKTYDMQLRSVGYVIQILKRLAIT